ncbi:Rho termination factor N-terminal domain-containing protein [Staphylococcus chromogenes]|uniref:Rho termination factor N-terminal domain-containing protein n=1 Tax=Staphylococcus chromogenes TaxID=46126 RepID=UPI0018909305|nr:Rho termination factor N-terminal domain-containing protein [Staphylococcus chromogenes]
MLSRVIEKFEDLEDDNHFYDEGDIYPRVGYIPSDERVNTLSSTNNKRDLQVISHINLDSLKVDELKELAKKRNVEGYSDMKKAELIEALEGAK